MFFFIQYVNIFDVDLLGQQFIINIFNVVIFGNISVCVKLNVIKGKIINCDVIFMSILIGCLMCFKRGFNLVMFFILSMIMINVILMMILNIILSVDGLF